MKRVLLIDNYDSFTFNLYQYLSELGAEVKVVKNDEVDLAWVKEFEPSYIVISPGPGTVENPEDFGVCAEVIRVLAATVPILGVCLGCQGIAYEFGASIEQAPEILHGIRDKVDLLKLESCKYPSIFEGISSPMEVMRYHSLVIARDSLGEDFVITAESVESKLIMAIQHKEYPLYGVQFHPESIGTKDGLELLKRFLEV